MRQYRVEVTISGMTAAKTMLLGQAPSSMVLVILGAGIRDCDNNTVTQLEYALSRVTTRGSPTGTTITAANVQKASKGDPNTSVTWLSDLTAEPTTYDANPLDHDGKPNTLGYDYTPQPEARKEISPSESFGLRLLTAPSATKMVAWIEYMELGG